MTNTEPIGNNKDVFQVQQEQYIHLMKKFHYDICGKEVNGKYFIRLMMLGGKSERGVRKYLGL